MAADRRVLLAGCDAAQRAAITSPAAPLLVVAGAGSGKTRVLTRRIAWRIAEEEVPAPHVLALTFTRKAAGELRARVAGLGLPAPITAGTFHAVALAQLRRRALDQNRHPPVILESKARILGRLVPPPPSRPTARGRAGRPANERDLLAALAGEIEWAKARLLAPAQYPEAATAERRRLPLDPERVATLYLAYEEEKRRRGVLDFDDLLVELTRAITRDPNFAAAQRWQFRHLFVDELQDANLAQLALLDAWLGGRPDLFAVGDPRQAIYGWNGADATGVTAFTTRYPGASVLWLERNYRSTTQVTTVADAALGAEAPARPEAGGPGELDDAEHVVREGPVPTVVVYPSDEAEAEGVVRALRRARPTGRAWADLAVLARTNAQLAPFELALARAGIPYRSGAGTAFLARPSVRDALDRLEQLASAGALETWLRDVELEAAGVFTLPPPATAGASQVRGSDPGDPTGRVGSDEGDPDLAALAGFARDYLALDPVGSRDGLLAFCKSALRADPAPGRIDAVELTTFHRAKGLEWPIVFVTGLEDGLVPITYATTPAALAEERRLLYVALSRAADELHCSWARVRTFGARSLGREPSPLLAALEDARRALEDRAAVRPQTVRDELAASRAVLRATTRTDDTPPARS